MGFGSKSRTRTRIAATSKLKEIYLDPAKSGHGNAVGKKTCLSDGLAESCSELPRMNPAHLLNAIAFAAHKHRRQRRKDADATPYINHPIAVATLLAVEGDVADQATLFCAILHDTVEDTDTTFSELEERFGQEVADLVRELTDDKSLKKYERKRLQIEHATQSSSRAKLVKLADKICNVRDLTVSPPTDWPLERRREYLAWSEKVVDGCRGVNPKLDQAFDEAVKLARDTLNLEP
jgi:guanosine-3',5'-bis(diphosphate) 3'-pyrophosphohydrolase